MRQFLISVHNQLPSWAGSWFNVLALLAQVGLIVLAAWLAMRVAHMLIRRLAKTYTLPYDIAMLTTRVVAFVVYGGAMLWALERLGVSGTVLWTALTGFAAVGAVAFFAAWSVLSNLFCALLIFTTRAFRPGDLIELIESGDKPGIRGRVLDINLVYTTLVEADAGTGSHTLQVPNSLFFQRVLRHWRDTSSPAER